MFATTRLLLLPALALALGLSGCAFVPNDGGERPAGTALAFTDFSLPEGSSCTLGREAVLVRDGETIDRLTEACAHETEDLAAFLQAGLDAISPDDALLFVGIFHGGCVEDYDIPLITLDGDIVRPWLIEDDRSHGSLPVACEDIGYISWQAFVVEGAGDATRAELSVGTWNSRLPGSPYEAHGLERPE